MKHPQDIIIRPVVSEKSYGLIDMNVYTFVVAPGSSKIEIRQAVEAIWPGVKVAKVNMFDCDSFSRLLINACIVVNLPA